MKMAPISFREIGQQLATAFRMKTRPLAVYGSDVLPPGIPRLAEVNRCFAVSLYRMASDTKVSAIYLSADTSEGCCPVGSSMWDTFRCPMRSSILYRPEGKTFAAELRIPEGKPGV